MSNKTSGIGKLDIDPKLFETPMLAEVQAELVPIEKATEQDLVRIEQLASEIDVSDSNSIIFFGAKAQEQLTTISDNMLEGVRNKDLGSAGDALSEMVAKLRGFDAEGLENPGFFARLFGRAKPVVKFLQQYEVVRKQIDKITDNLEGHKTKLLTDIVSLDRLYNANLDYFHELELYITAGEEKLRELDTRVIPVLEKSATETDEVLKAQELRDLRSARDDLERRVHDLRLTRQVTLQSLPSIRLVQENDKGLVTKINSTLVNTVPLWRQQLATAVTIFRSGEAAKSVKAATDLTNDLLEKNAENLKEATIETRKQLERGVFDIETVKKANQTLIDTIEESLRIADEGKRLRAEAVVQLQEAETELKKSLAAAKARGTGGAVAEV
ncbi:MAG: toxic anion resistance protein [Gammaproteobacteria bacterium]|nr:toxic anion resistance protein [Gammaproteobacteria bacterium]